MEFRPFGKDLQGQTIQDVSGITVRANMEYLEELVTRTQGAEAVEQTLEQLVDLLNHRIPDRTYHVNIDFLKNPWNSYSYEFVMFLSEFCVQLSGEDRFHFNLGRSQFLSPIIQILGRPFSITQIYRLFPYFVEKFTKGALQPSVVSVTNGHAVMRLQFSESSVSQFGEYLYGCAERVCETTKATIAEVPARMFGKKASVIQDTCCIADGAPYCEWEFRWEPQEQSIWGWILTGILLALATIGIFTVLLPHQPWWVHSGFGLFPLLLLPLAGRLWGDRTELEEGRKIIQEQLESAEQRHEELREAYLQQEHILVEVRRRVDELTMLHQLTLQIGSTLNRTTIIESGLQALVASLHYDHGWIVLWDPQTKSFKSHEAVGIPKTCQSAVRTHDIPLTPQDLFLSTLHSREALVMEDTLDYSESWDSTTRALIESCGMKSGIALSLTSQQEALGVLVLGSQYRKPLSLTEQNLVSTVAHQLALALETAMAYDEIEALNLGLEAKVQARTAELQQVNQDLESANERLQELDRMKSKFLSHCSHELRTPLTSIKGFSENMLQKMVGPLTERQHLYLTRVIANADRLTRMIADLLDLSRIESGTIRLSQQPVSLTTLLKEATEELLPLTQKKNQQLQMSIPEEELVVMGDPDRLHQIVTNLVHNAHKFTPSEGQITVKAEPLPPQDILLTVSDTGPGIPEESLANLFQPFFQAHRTPEIGTQGLGLGLSIVKQLVDLHKGTITVESTLGQGTIFHIHLSRHQDLSPTPLS